MKLTALIVDDERLGRQIIREYLKPHPEIEIIGECRDAHETLAALEKSPADLMFLDIQMPEINGFELLEMLPQKPLVIFSTAYDQYAIKAFEVNAIDYLLKPFDKNRFEMALTRALENLEQRTTANFKLKQLLQNLPAPHYQDRFLIKQAGKIVILNCREIAVFEAMEDYVNIHTARDRFLIQQTMHGLLPKLNPAEFIQVHRSFIVNINFIQEMETSPSGSTTLYLKTGEKIGVSRSGMKRLRELFL